MKTVTVIYERDEDGWWVATAKGVPGCHTQGRTIEQARSRIREVLELAVSGSQQAQLKEQMRLPSKAALLLAKREAAQRHLVESEAKSRELTLRAVQTLVGDLELSVRDAGALLGISHQRVQQLSKPRAPRSGVAAKGG